ncbi:hypothetical protein DIPPA_20104 [Diplonema papillatum]|nr:hypothetical protein DIPPA_23112 [Diplonema papillatum]KAJ9465943.1 hypothetical protein DIPPA_20104 [Diplonema papillatum]
MRAGLVPQLITGALSMLCCVMICTALADGRSLFKLANATRAKDASVAYGVGIFHDTNGFEWNDSEHLFQEVQCIEHSRRGKLVKGCSIVASVASCFAAYTALRDIADGFTGITTIACNIVMFITFLVAMGATWSIYDQSFGCMGQSSLRVSDNFNVQYGVIVLVVGTVASMANITLLVALVSK